MRRRRVLGLATATMAGLAGCLGDTEFTVTDVAVGETSAPLALDVAVEDAGVTVDSPAVLAMSLRNDGSETLSVRATGVWPFGLLALDRRDETGRSSVLLLSDQYANAEHVEVTANSAHSDNEPLVRRLDAGESVSRQYEVHGERVVRPGDYSLQGYFEPVVLQYRPDERADWAAFEPDVTVTIAERSLLP